MDKRKKILIVEDEEINRRILKKILQADYDIEETKNGQEGWDYLMGHKKEIAAVLLDVVMPIMNGYEFLNKLQEAGIQDLPVIVTTGDTDSESEQKVLGAGAWDFVTKPYNAKVLLGRLRNAIARSQVALYEQMQKMAAHDWLTGLHNRGRMFEQTRKMIDDNSETSFVFVRLDIDHFALYNTSFGENEGNRLLKYMANCLREFADTAKLCKFCRMSADIFCACLDYDGNREYLEERINHMQEQLKEYKKDYLLALSAGACLVDNVSLSIDDLYFRATIAARECKNQFETYLAFYDESAGEKIANEMVITNEMQTALEQKQFEVYLQPKFRVATDHVCGAEALVRWKHPIKGMISPGAFIPVFENNGFITKLDYYVWDRTCQMLQKWTKEEKTPYPVSVNISRISLYNPGLVDILKDLVKKYEISPALLQLEITESAYMTNPELMEGTIHSLHEAGFTILMDDFGSGYSSLNTLKRIYIDILKIDMRFLPVGQETERGEIILACIIKMANLLGMSVVTEGVETRRQRDFLEGAGCDSIQGYYYSRPIPQKEYEEKYIHLDDREDEYDDLDQVVPKHNVTILIIDDIEVERVMIRQNLQDMYHVHACDSAEAGLAYLKKNQSRVKLVLVDNLMPGMKGIEFLRYCQLDNSLKAIPKIMITANDTSEDQVEAFNAGAYDYIAKPITREVLLARVNHVMAVSSQTFIFDAIERDYKQISERDSLTGLLNKMAFHELASRIMQISSDDVNSLLVIDIDNFKRVNDENGHLMGDEVLKCVASELNNALRKTDIIGRFGGDEFVVMMTKIPNREAAKRKASEIIKSVTFACVNQLNIETSISIGISFSDTINAEEALFARADQALYEAKNNGKARAVVYGEKVPPVQNNDKPVVLICSEDPQLYPAIALAYGDEAAFANITSFNELRTAFEVYTNRICTVCMDMRKQHMEDANPFYEYIVSQGGGSKIPILAFCKEGNVHQMREALKLDVMDLLSLPPHIDTIQHRLSMAITKGRLVHDGE